MPEKIFSLRSNEENEAQRSTIIMIINLLSTFLVLTSVCFMFTALTCKGPHTTTVYKWRDMPAYGWWGMAMFLFFFCTVLTLITLIWI